MMSLMCYLFWFACVLLRIFACIRVRVFVLKFLLFFFVCFLFFVVVVWVFCLFLCILTESLTFMIIKIILAAGSEFESILSLSALCKTKEDILWSLPGNYDGFIIDSLCFWIFFKVNVLTNKAHIFCQGCCLH